MSDTSRSRLLGSFSLRLVAFSAICLVGLLIRLLRLSWQPLWWDEGYSVYFATEPLARMLDLTALDIHPPLYYAALHGWIAIFDSTAPAHLRIFSAIAGTGALLLFWWMASTFFGPFYASASKRKFLAVPTNSLIVGLALLLLALNPLHIYYSQEIRMYGLALVFSIWSTAAVWHLIKRSSLDVEFNLGLVLAYITSTTLALYTLYYSALIPIAHLVYILWKTCIRKHLPLRALRAIVAAQIGISILYLPWVIFVAPKLITYITNKVSADNDIPLSLPIFLGRHAIAFFFGHLPLPLANLIVASQLVGWSILLLFGLAIIWRQLTTRGISSATPLQNAKAVDYQLRPIPALWAFLLIPMALGYFINLIAPFFPVGGERLLLIVLPYGLLLIAAGIAEIRNHWLRILSLVLIVGAAVFGISLFYSYPRHVDRDYRQLVAHVMQNSRPDDKVLTIFPWQVGYWRAYASEATEIGPAPVLLTSAVPENVGTLTWNTQIQRQIEKALKPSGALWFPMPMGLGSSLPTDIEDYLGSPELSNTFSDSEVILFEEKWVNSTTFLTAWQVVSKPQLRQVDYRFDEISLVGVALGQDEIHSNNELLVFQLNWQGAPNEQDNAASYVITVRLQDGAQRIWSQRDYPLLGHISSKVDAASNSKANFDIESSSGLIIPAGLPPGVYDVQIGVSVPSVTGIQPQVLSRTSPAEVQPGFQQLRPLSLDHPEGIESTHGDPHFANIGSINVVPPVTAPSPYRLSTDERLSPPQQVEGIVFWGSSGLNPNTTILAGTSIPLKLHLQNQNHQGKHNGVFVSLLASDGSAVAGRAGWPLPDYQLSQWATGALVQIPIPIQLPATVTTGKYRLITGLTDLDSGEKSGAVELGKVNVEQRTARFTSPTISFPLRGGPAHFGTHVDLLGFELFGTDEVGSSENANTVDIRLHWHVQQSLLPSHHIFIHLVDKSMVQPFAQHDDMPTALRQESGQPPHGPAPTGSWQPGEYLTTYHLLSLPSDTTFDPHQNIILRDQEPLQLRVGLYLPKTGVRLPVSFDNDRVDDSVPLFPEE